MEKLFVAVLAFLLLAGCTRTPDALLFADTPSLPAKLLQNEEARNAYEVLRDARRFESPHVGVSGSPSTYAVAFRTLLDHTKNAGDAKHVFRMLFREATLAGKLYATCGFYFVDSDGFEAAVGTLAIDERPVHVMMGCIMTELTVAELIRIPASSGQMRITVTQGMTLEQWMTAHPGPGQLDIAGGYVPLRLLDDHDTMPAPRSPL